MPSSPVKLTSQVKFRHSSSKLQLHSRTQKSCALFCHFMALILTPFSFQRIWKLFLNNYFQTDGVVTVSDILTFFRSCTPGQLKLMSQVSKLHLQPNNSLLWMHSLVGKAVKWHSRDLYFCYCRIHNTSDQACRLVSRERYNQFAWFKISHVRQSL